MKAIVTKYHGPGNVRGSRISASDSDGNRVILHRDCALSVDQNRDRAALALCRKLGWTGTLAHGGLNRRGDEVYVWVDSKDLLTVTAEQKGVAA
jgi:hypothetical protein